MTFANMESVATAIMYYAKNPKYCPIHNLEMLPSVNRFTDNSNSKAAATKFMRLEYPKQDCTHFDKALSEWFATITNKATESVQRCGF